jgi:hypothetical protein
MEAATWRRPRQAGGGSYCVAASLTGGRRLLCGRPLVHGVDSAAVSPLRQVTAKSQDGIPTS